MCGSNIGGCCYDSTIDDIEPLCIIDTLGVTCFGDGDEEGICFNDEGAWNCSEVYSLP